MAGAAGAAHQQCPPGHRPPLQQEQGHEGHDACGERGKREVTAGPEPAVVHGHRATGGAEHPLSGSPAPGVQPERGHILLGLGVQARPHVPIPAVQRLPSRGRAPHLPPGRRSPASLPGGAPHGIPTFRKGPGDDLLGLIKYAKRFPSPLSLSRRCGNKAPPRPRLTHRGRPQGNLPPANPPCPLQPQRLPQFPCLWNRHKETPGMTLQLPETPARRSLDAEQGDP